MKLRHLQFTDMNIAVNDSRLYIYSSDFLGSSHLYVGRQNREYVKDAVHTRLGISNCRWLCQAECSSLGGCLPSCSIKTDIFLTYETTSKEVLYIKHSVFIDTALRLTLIPFDRAKRTTILNCTFTSGPLITPGGLHLNVLTGELDKNFNVTVENSSFYNISTVLPQGTMEDVRAFSVSMARYKNTIYHGYSRFSAFLQNATFEGNHRAVTIEGSYIQYVTINESIFRNNYALQSEGAAIHLRTEEEYFGTTNTILNTIFENNMAGFAPFYVQQNDRVLSNKRGVLKIRKNDTATFELILRGKGGALTLYDGKYTDILDCSFINNSAHSFGGTIFQTSTVDLTLMNVTFQTSGQNLAEHGEILYALGGLFIKSANFVVHKTLSHISIVKHSLSKIMSLTIFNMTFTCPPGFALDVDKTTALNPELYEGYLYGSEKDFAYLDRITLSCKPCKRGLYSTDQGYLELATSSETGIAVVFFEHRGITCRPCPFGGICEEEIRSVPGYWGYQSNGEIFLQHCIQGQCCDTDPCPGYDHCAANRGGILCSQCVAGYSRATFSQVCVPDTECGIWWFWPVTFGLGLVYALFLLFQDDLIETATQLLKKISGDDIPHKIKSNKVHNATTVHVIMVKSPNHLPREEKIQCQHEQIKKSEDHETKGNDSPDYLQILVNFIQDAALFYVYMPNTKSDSQSLILKLFGFTLAAVNFVDNACFMASLSAVQLLLIKSVVGPFLLVLYSTLYWLLNEMEEEFNYKENPDKFGAKFHWALRKRLPSAFMLTLLFSYQSLLISGLTLLQCIDIDKTSLLKIDTTVECHQRWQRVVLAYVVSCSIPFPFLLMIIPNLLQRNVISEEKALYSGVFPLPFMISWIRKKRQYNRLSPAERLAKTEKNRLENTDAIYNLFQGPYRDIHVKGFGSVCWTGITTTKRLLLCVTYTFLGNSLVRVVVLMLIHLLGMLQLFFHHPYKQINGNRAEIFLSGVLLMIGMANVVRGAFESAQYIPKGPDASLVEVIDTAETVLLQWVPASLGCLFFVYVLSKGLAKRMMKKYV